MASKKALAKHRNPRRKSFTLENLDQIRVLADPLRIRILEAFTTERTTKQVAELLGEKPTKLYHHVDALARVGLVALSRTSPKRGTVEKYYLAVARTFRTDSRTLQPKEKRGGGGGKQAAMRRMMSTIFDTTSTEVAALLDRSDGSAGAMAEEAVVSFLEIRATEAQIVEIRGKLHELVQSLGESAETAATQRKASPERRYRLTLAYYPLDALPATAGTPAHDAHDAPEARAVRSPRKR